MIKLLDHAWRVFATGLAFAMFGVGGVLLRVIYFPLLQWMVRAPDRRARLARLSTHHCFRAFIALMSGLGLLRYRVVGAERLRRSNLLILANHPTLIDVVFLISLVPNADCVVKARLGEQPVYARTGAGKRVYL